MDAPQPDLAQHARHLILIAADLRAAGDITLVEIGHDGVSLSSATLAAELEYIAMGVDWDAAMEAAREREQRKN